MHSRITLIQKYIRAIPDFPKPGILFRDITPVLAHYEAFHAVTSIFKEHCGGKQIDAIVGIESRGFILGGALAMEMNCGLHLVRKPGRLPCETDEIAYELEYGSGRLQIHKGQIPKGTRVLIVDDLLATGGTAYAAAKLCQKQGAEVVEAVFMIELAELGGKKHVAPLPTFSILTF